jgi:adenylate kinase
MRYALTGTPGTGKTSVAKVLRERGYDVLDMTQYIKDHDLREEYDEERDTYAVDVDRLNDALAGMQDCIFEGHLSHFMDVDTIIVLRCHPDVLAERLRARGYGDAKVRENVQAEVLDVIFSESMDSGIPTFSIDASSSDPSETANIVEDIMKGDTHLCVPPITDWTEEMDRWL